MYELFEHTADLGLRATAPDLDTLFVDIATCLFSAIVEDGMAVRPAQDVRVEIEGTDPEYLLFDWLRRLLYHGEADHLLFCRFDARVTPTGLIGTAWGEPFDPDRHALAREVKAVTYHGLKVEQTADGWLAEVIVDI